MEINKMLRIAMALTIVAVSLDSIGNVTGIYANSQPQMVGQLDYAELEDTDPRIAAYCVANPWPAQFARFSKTRPGCPK
jgi:hypothetical protein